MFVCVLWVFSSYQLHSKYLFTTFYLKFLTPSAGIVILFHQEESFSLTHFSPQTILHGTVNDLPAPPPPGLIIKLNTLAFSVFKIKSNTTSLALPLITSFVHEILQHSLLFVLSLSLYVYLVCSHNWLSPPFSIWFKASFSLGLSPS